MNVDELALGLSVADKNEPLFQRCQFQRFAGLAKTRRRGVVGDLAKTGIDPRDGALPLPLRNAVLAIAAEQAPPHFKCVFDLPTQLHYEAGEHTLGRHRKQRCRTGAPRPDRERSATVSVSSEQRKRRLDDLFHGGRYRLFYIALERQIYEYDKVEIACRRK